MRLHMARKHALVHACVTAFITLVRFLLAVVILVVLKMVFQICHKCTVLAPQNLFGLYVLWHVAPHFLL